MAVRTAGRTPPPPRHATPDARTVGVELVWDEAHATRVLGDLVLGARRSLFLSTANAKDVRVPAPVGTRDRARGRYVSLLGLLAERVRDGLELRFLHAGALSRPFRASLARWPALGRCLRSCPRVHLKMIAKDGERLYLGSANFTGAGLGERGDERRNFELGLVTSDDVLLDAAQARFDRIWRGAECGACKLRGECPDPIDLLVERAASPTKPSPTKATPTKASPANTPPTKAKATVRSSRRPTHA
ncbi:MAG: phospholipase [Myxococcales bacterium]|nr:phospholipase [Myxococcales bacterium]HQY64191.1 phospholipase D-like domain-containing protein [Polyangiaceae bacterium]